MRLEKKKEHLPSRQPIGSTLEQQAVQAYTEPQKVYRSANIELKQTLLYIFALLGVTNYPDPNQELVLLDFIRKNFGAFSLKEIRLAFDMAAAGQLDVDVNHYQAFTAPYFARVMNTYKNWVSEIRKANDKPVIESPSVEITEGEFRGMIESAYKSFSAKTNYRLWPAEFYGQLVSDKFMPADYYESKVKQAKNFLLGGVQQSLTMEQDDVRTKDMENLLSEYRGGEREAEVVLLAKQLSVKDLFEKGKIKGISLYEKA